MAMVFVSWDWRSPYEVAAYKIILRIVRNTSSSYSDEWPGRTGDIVSRQGIAPIHGGGKKEAIKKKEERRKKQEDRRKKKEARKEARKKEEILKTKGDHIAP